MEEKIQVKEDDDWLNQMSSPFLTFIIHVRASDGVESFLN